MLSHKVNILHVVIAYLLVLLGEFQLNILTWKHDISFTAFALLQDCCIHSEWIKHAPVICLKILCFGNFASCFIVPSAIIIQN